MKGYRTIFINIVPPTILAIDYFAANGTLTGALFGTPESAAVGVGVLNMLNIYLRAITNTAMGKGE